MASRYEAEAMHIVIFIAIILIGGGVLGVLAVQTVNTAPPHAGIMVSEDSSGDVQIQINNMGQSDKITVIVNGSVVGTLTESSDIVTIEGTANNTRRVQVVSDNGYRELLLRDFYV